MTAQDSHNTRADQAHWGPQDDRRLLTKWLAGVGLALVPIAYGVYCIVTDQALLPGGYDFSSGVWLEVRGSAAHALATAYIAVGVLVHLNWFWASYPRLALARSILTGMSLVVVVVSLVLAICWIMTRGTFAS